MTMPAGQYYVGDLCYVIEEWDEVCDLIIKDEQILDGEFELSDGRKFAIYSTAYGDGVYNDQYARDYPVDAGSIGCILVGDISRKDYGDRIDGDLGNFHTFEKPFQTYSEDGVLTFGHVKIDTDPEYEEDEWDYEPDEYDEWNGYDPDC